MDKMLQNLIHNKSDLRKISILKILIDANEIVSSYDIAKKLNYTNRTIINDISELKTQIPKNWYIESVASKGYRLKKPLIENVSIVIRGYLVNSALYKILLAIFEGKYYSLEKWSQLLFLNRTTLRKLLTSFKKILNIYNLDWDYKEVQLLGDELNIRYFYCIFFNSMQRYILNFQIHLGLEKNIKKHIRYSRIKVDFNCLSILLKVFINRILQKKTLNGKEYFGCIFDSNQKQCLHNIVEELEKNFSLILPENEKEYLYTSIFLITECPTMQIKKNDSYFDLFKKYNFLEYNELFNFIKNKLTIGNNLKEQFNQYVMYYLYKIFLLKNENLPITNISYTEIKIKEFSEISQKIYFLIKEWVKEINNQILIDAEILYISNKIAHIIYTDARNIKVLVTLSGSHIWKKLIYSRLYKELYDSFTLFVEFDDNDTYDFIISNYQINSSKTPVIYISEELEKKELVSINQILTTEANRRVFV
ncbi:helix-turn-helix domain containing protein [Bacillus cereus group sp. BfR-BA-01354]|uniref:helix-turn-helix domain-containing protein n=1 Tax=Bacillus cereus group sp. BfR-BA-01354 TaxID=2920317 RepID=UPI001F58862B